jgi:hypothetical protein
MGGMVCGILDACGLEKFHFGAVVGLISGASKVCDEEESEWWRKFVFMLLLVTTFVFFFSFLFCRFHYPSFLLLLFCRSSPVDVADFVSLNSIWTYRRMPLS